jgi:hypothetical protein
MRDGAHQVAGAIAVSPNWLSKSGFQEPRKGKKSWDWISLSLCQAWLCLLGRFHCPLLGGVIPPPTCRFLAMEGNLRHVQQSPGSSMSTLSGGEMFLLYFVLKYVDQ